MAEPLDKLATTDNDILLEARDRLKLASDAESGNRTEALTDLEFVNGNQWNADIFRGREADGRPCLTINLTDSMVRRVTNALRENRPRIKCHPVGSGADVQTAKVVDGLIRHIEAASSADLAYDTAVESAVRGGWGYWQVRSKYVEDDSFEQDLTIERVRNPFTVYMDPAAEMPDGSDMNWCLVSKMIPRTEYRDQYGELDPNGWQFVGAGDQIADWSNREQIRIAEYWRVVRKMGTLYLLSDGSKAMQMPPKDSPIQAIKKRPMYQRKIEWHLISATKILDQRDWPGKWIPVIPCYGREVDVNGKIHRKGMVRDLRDPARMFNFAETAKTETYGLQPKAPWLMAEGQMEGHEAEWRDANRKPTVALAYKPMQGPDGAVLPPPARQMPPEPASGFTEWSESSKNNFLAIAGMPNDPGQDSKGEVVSGIALRRRQGLSDISHFDFYDNQTRSMRHTGTIILDLVPHFYDTQRMQRIIAPDGTPDTTTINEKVRDPLTNAVLKVKNDMTVGRYDVVMDTGPGYQTAREEGSEAMLELLGTPLGEMVAQGAGDVVVRSMNFPDADTIADRIAANIPGAQIDKQSDIPPKAQMMIQSLQAQLKNANQARLALEMELPSKHQLEQIRQTGETERTHIKVGAQVHDTQIRAETAVHDTTIKAITAHDVAEIKAGATLLNTNLEATHERAAAKELLKHADEAAESKE